MIMEDKDKPNIFNGKEITFTVPDNNDPSIQDTIDNFVDVQHCSIIDIMFGGIESNPIRKFIIKNFPEPVRKPSNLKYPNKKRKMRVLKKWCNRYGWKHGRYIVIPRARCNGVVLKDGVPAISYTAEEISK